ncbi:hypothetical protein J7M23_05915 [Candidatus Sumerlaeota bacterium]|nr:hypothetical protein [Candidatus Sumerlaeota bacterium]
MTDAVKTGFKYAGKSALAVAMPMGGVGAGSIAICPDGSLRQWQIFNLVNHNAYIPHSFFALRCEETETHRSVVRCLLQKRNPADDSGFTPAPLVTDHIVPEQLSNLKQQLPCVTRTEFYGFYPFARILFLDEELPLSVELEAFSPLIPLDTKNSALPCIIFRFSLKNRSAKYLICSLLGTMQNAVGYDGHTPIDGVYSPCYGGNFNEQAERQGFIGVMMKNNALSPDDIRQGNMFWGVWQEDILKIRLTSWDNLAELWRDFANSGSLPETPPLMPTPRGKSVNSAILATIDSLEPHQSTEVWFLLSWYFPHRYVNWEQIPVVDIPSGVSSYLGNYYATWFNDAGEVAEYVARNKAELRESTRDFQRRMSSSSLPDVAKERASAQISVLRSPTCFWAGDGNFYGFEGCCGASTEHCQLQGCCPLNCTHVWNYEMTLAYLFPSLERTMREVELLHQLDPKGELPHRVILPLTLPRPWDTDIGGPLHCALDGMLGTILKTYREVIISGDRNWLESLWSPLTRLIRFIFTKFDPHKKGVIEGEQPNTYDTSIYGLNTFIGSLWLAGLRAVEEMAKLMNDHNLAEDSRSRFEKGREHYDTELWNGEYYEHHPLPGQSLTHGWGKGCHSDQLLGVWWARLLRLGDILPPEHVRQALLSILRYNFKPSLLGVEQSPRVFATEDEGGLLNCTWPHGGRPETPVLYCDEVWTGIEYEVSALCIFEGLLEEGIKILETLHRRYNGTRRNPYNEIECGDHYVRALASWSVILALSGFFYNALSREIYFQPRWSEESFSAQFTTGSGWGSVQQTLHWGGQTTPNPQPSYSFAIDISQGSLLLETIHIFVSKKMTKVFATGLHQGLQNTFECLVDGEKQAISCRLENNWLTIDFPHPISVIRNLKILAHFK